MSSSPVRRDPATNCAGELAGTAAGSGTGEARCTWQVYLVRCADGTLYCGCTNNLARRLRQHNGELAGGARYTRSRRPVHLVLAGSCPSRTLALRCEARIKKAPARRKQALLQALCRTGREEAQDRPVSPSTP